MKKDFLSLVSHQKTEKRLTKETLNHPGIIALASGQNPFTETQTAYVKAYEALGIDFINRVPEENATHSLRPGDSMEILGDYKKSYLGVYDTYTRWKYPYKNAEDFFDSVEIDLDYHQLITPVPHFLDRDVIERKMKIVDDIGLYYYMLYTNLFMWGVEYLGWEVFMTAATINPEIFKTRFLNPAAFKSREAIKILSSVTSPFVFVHDDLASAQGSVFQPEWYDRYIFPRYEFIWEPARKAGKKIIFTADGNMSALLKPLKEVSVDGVMLESPATDFDRILDVFGDSIVIGGIDTRILTFGTPEMIRIHVKHVHKMTEGILGYVMSSCGGLHGNIPIRNLEVYFDTRAELGYTPGAWRAKR